MGKAFAAALAILLSTGYSPGPETADLGWMAGRWVQETADGWAEESWSPPRGGVMLGTGLTGRGARATSFEFMRIDDGGPGGGTVFWGSPGGQASVAFPMVRSAVREAVFENPQHDYPTRIAYRRDGRTLVATTSGQGGSNPKIWRYQRTRD